VLLLNVLSLASRQPSCPVSSTSHQLFSCYVISDHVPILTTNPPPRFHNSVKPFVHLSRFILLEQHYNLLLQHEVSDPCGCHSRHCYMGRCCRESSSGDNTFEQYWSFISKVHYCNNHKKHLNGSDASHTIASNLVPGKSHTSFDFSQRCVVPLLQDFTHPRSHFREVFTRSFIFIIQQIENTL
jgi:hypothetical protein